MDVPKIPQNASAKSLSKDRQFSTRLAPLMHVRMTDMQPASSKARYESLAIDQFVVFEENSGGATGPPPIAAKDYSGVRLPR